jgi:hypothetical protein
MEAYFIGNKSVRPAKFITDPGGDGRGGNPARLRAADQSVVVWKRLKTHFGNLGGFAGSGIPGDNSDLVGTDAVDNLSSVSGDRQFRWIKNIHFPKLRP